MNRRFAILSAALACASVGATRLPYDEEADARSDLRQAVQAAQFDGRFVLVLFGANWCEDCRALNLALNEKPIAALVARDFEIVKVDVGRFSRNLDVAKDYGDPIRKGIPAAVVLSPSGRVVYATRAGELARARHMSESGIRDFLDGVLKVARAAR